MNRTGGPLVSIVTPVLNGMPDIRACLDSVATQTYPHIEHILVDGCSTDGTVELIADYAARYPDRVRFTSEPDSGCGDAWAKGVRMAHGQILGCLGADDLCEPGAVDAVAVFFREHPDAMFVHGGCRQVWGDGTAVIHRPTPFDYRTFVRTARHIATPSSYYRRELVEHVGPVEECGNDFEFMLRVARVCQVHSLDATLSTLSRRVGTAFNPLDPVRRAVSFRDDYEASRRHGGGRLSPIALRYYWAALSARLGIQPTSRIARGLSAAARAVRAHR
ncbi:MAG: glycosyltransferase [Acidobacteria bacterium]|nr:glycosyltransferase [Acidobacteriota bacterium]